MWIIIVTFAIFLWLLHSWLLKPYKYWKDKGIPYVEPLPIVGNVGPNLLHKKAFADLLQEWYTAYSEYRYVGFYQFSSPTLIIRDPELIKQIVIKEFDTFPDHRAFVSEDMDPLWSKNLFAMKGGAKWQDMRSTLSPSFTSSKLKMMFDLMKNCSRQFVSYVNKQEGLAVIDMKDTFTRFTNDVIATTAFGVGCNSLDNPENEFFLMGKEATNFSGIRNLKFFLYALSPALMKALDIGIFSKEVSNFFRKVIKENIRTREEKDIIRPDMLHLLMEARKGRLKLEDSTILNKPELTDDDITAQALVFFIGGFDSVSNLMCFAAYELAVNPDMQNRLREEIIAAIKKDNNELTYENLMGMKYLEMFISETLRKWPPGIIGDRVSVKSFTIEPKLAREKAVTLDPGTNIWIPTYAMHRDPNYFPEPEKFDPERFNEENKRNIQSFTYLPFGAGPRNCIGARFAVLETKLVIAEIVRHFEIVPVEKTQIPLQISKSHFNLLPESGLWLGLKSIKTTS